GDIFAAKYDSSGSLVWARSAGSGLVDIGLGLALDAASNVYVTGSFGGLLFSVPSDSFVWKLDNAGNPLWFKTFGGAGHDIGVDLAVDNAGNVFTVGRFNGTADFDPGPSVFNLTSDTLYGNFLSKIDGAGNFVWAKSLPGNDTLNYFGNLAIDLDN